MLLLSLCRNPLFFRRRTTERGSLRSLSLCFSFMILLALAIPSSGIRTIRISPAMSLLSYAPRTAPSLTASHITTAIPEMLRPIVSSKQKWTHLLYAIISNESPLFTSLSNATQASSRYERGILNRQMRLELQRHNADLMALISEIGCQLLTYATNVFKRYILGLSFLLPFSTKLDLLARVQLHDPYLLNFYNLPDKATPSSFGLSYSDVLLQSSSEKELTLGGWFVFSKDSNSNKAILCIHGLNSNRQGCLPFLQVAKKVGILNRHHALLLDLRNTGASSTVQKDLGTDAAADIYDGVVYLKNTYGVSSISFYCQSMGAMAFMVFMDKYKQQLLELGVNVDRIVMESPVLNVKEALRVQLGALSDVPLINWLFDILFSFIRSKNSNGVAHSQAAYLLSNLNARKTLLLQSAQDPYLNWGIMTTEFKNMNENQVPKNIYVFERGLHGNIMRDNKDDYESLIRHHFEWYSIASILRGRRYSKATKRIDQKDLLSMNLLKNPSIPLSKV